MTAICVSYLGLSQEKSPIPADNSAEPEVRDALLRDILDAGEVGYNEAGIHKVSGANKNSINLMKRVALKDMRDVRELLFENSWKEKTLKRFLEYCYMIDVKVALEGLNGEKTRGLKAAVKYVKEHDIGMTEEQIHAVYCVRYHILPLHVGI